MSRSRMKLILMLCLLLAACRGEAWQADPGVIAAREACASLSDIEQYNCIEKRAVAALNPDICRLAGIWIDDACLQAVYEAANDPAICDQIYLQGVVPNCRAYYAKYTPFKPPATEMVLAPTQAVSPATVPSPSPTPSQANPPSPGSMPSASTTPKESTTEQEWQLYIYSREGYPAIYAVRPDGSGLTKLMDEYAGILEAALSPDGVTDRFHSQFSRRWHLGYLRHGRGWHQYLEPDQHNCRCRTVTLRAIRQVLTGRLTGNGWLLIRMAIYLRWRSMAASSFD